MIERREGIKVKGLPNFVPTRIIGTPGA